MHFGGTQIILRLSFSIDGVDNDVADDEDH